MFMTGLTIFSLSENFPYTPLTAANNVCYNSRVVGSRMGIKANDTELDSFLKKSTSVGYLVRN
jgi:hypothetical protein